MRKNVTNKEQETRIATDVLTLKTARDWQGNSYSGTAYAENNSYDLLHWSTRIATVQDGALTYFDARYHSATTRGFQGRILRGLARAGIDVSAARQELSKPTHERGVVRP